MNKVKSRSRLRLVPGIKFRLFLLGFIPAGVTLLCLISYYVLNRSNDLNSALQQRGSTIARQLTAAALDRTRNVDVRSLQKIADTLLTEVDILKIRILDSQGNILVVAEHSRKDIDDASIIFEDYIISPNLFPITGRVDRGRSTSPAQQSPSPISRDTPEIIGKVQIYLSKSTTIQNQQIFLRNSLLIAFSGLVVTFLFAYFFGQQISIPILNLIQTVSAITNGNLSARVKYSGNRELRELQRGLNTMTAALQKNQAHLERRIYNATVRLQETLRSIEEKNLKLEEARSQADKQNKTKSQFLAHVSHEIRTPMNGILGFVELLSQSELNPTQLDQLTLIERSAKNLLTIINEILDLSKIESGEFKFSPTTFNIRNYLEDTVSLLCPQRDDLEIILYVDPEFPSLIRGDPLRLQQIMTNLIGNSLKFTESGRIVIRTRQLRIADKDYALLSVSDTGCGIAQNSQQDLFSPFLRLSDFDIDHSQGTGLGLAISKNMIEAMQGRIGVISRANVGSTFWIILPLIAKSTLAPKKVPVSANLIDGSGISASALQSQLKAVGISSRHFASVDRFLAANHKNTTDTRAVAILIINPENSEPETDQMIERLRPAVSDELLVAGTSLQIEKIKKRNEHQVHGLITLPCRSSFLLKSLADLSGEIECFDDEIRVKTKSSLSCNNLTFLVSDDNEINRVLLKSQLQETGAVVLEARDGKESIELLNAVAFDLIFLDLQMPVMNGMDIMRYLLEHKNINQKTPVIAVTAHALPHQRAAVLETGFADCLIKPVLQPNLEQILTNYVKPANKFVETEIPPAAIDSGQMVEALLLKTNGDAHLAERLLKQLFSEIPGQIEAIGQNIHQEKYEAAREITHKMNGSLSFCAIDNTRQAAAKLEKALTERQDGQSASDNFINLKSEIERLLTREEAILESVRGAHKTSSESSD